MDELMRWPLPYIAGQAVFCGLGLVLLGARWREHELFSADYWRFLVVPWRLAFFVAAWAGIVLLAPFTGDPTWDAVDASFMAILAWATAPAVVGTLYRAARGWRSRLHMLPALAVGLFSASWSYDLYLYARDGAYPVTWSGNLYASSFLYVCAGLFWSLEWSDARGRVVPAFMDREGWPPAPRVGSFVAVMRFAWVILIPIMLFFLAFPFIEYVL